MKNIKKMDKNYIPIIIVIVLYIKFYYKGNLDYTHISNNEKDYYRELGESGGSGNTGGIGSSGVYN